MSLLNSPAPASVASLPFKVRMEPYLIETVCELARVVRDKADIAGDLTGLLFGRIEDGLRIIEALKTFVDAGPHSELARLQRLDQAFKSSLEEAKNDPELSVLDVVGWFSFRNGTGLLSSDVAFHNQQFRKPEDLALIVWREGPSQITAEIYSKPEHDSLTAEAYRWGSVRLSADIRHMREPIELQMRPRVGDDAYLNAYEVAEPEGPFSSILKKAEAASDKLFSLFSKSKDEIPNIDFKGYISDGRFPMTASWPPEAPESLNPQQYFNPYAESTRLRAQRAAITPEQQPAAAAPAPFPAPAPAPAPVFPGVPPFPGIPAQAPQPAFHLAAHPNLPHPGLSHSPAPMPEFRSHRNRPQYALPAAPSVDLGNLGQTPRARRPPSEVSGLPMVLRQEPRTVSPWPWAAALFVACSAVVFAFLAFGGLQGENGRLGQAFRAMFSGEELNLRVRNEDDRLRLTWNQRNRSVAASSGGTLQIFDGQQHREIHLEGRQVADGSVLYRPLTNDVTFRLDIRGEQGAVSGSVRVLDGLASNQQEVLDVSAPRTAQAYQPATTQTGDTPPAAALVNDPHLLAESSVLRDPSAPGLVRSGPTPSGIETATIAPPYPAAANPARQRYESPVNVGTFSTAGGSAVNGWDTPPAPRNRYKSRTAARSTRPAFATGPASPTGYVPPRPVMQVMPRTSSIPNGAVQTRTRVQVQVRVDSAGKVAGAQVTGEPVNEAVASAALAAARQWTFQPATNDGARVVSSHTIVFEFRPER